MATGRPGSSANQDDPLRFLSLGDRESGDALADVRARPEYDGFGRRLREHLDTAERRTFELVAEV